MTLSTNVFLLVQIYRYLHKNCEKKIDVQHIIYTTRLYVYLPIINVRRLVVCTNIILAQFSDDDVFVWISILFNLKNVTTKGDISFKSPNTNKCLKLIVVENQYVYNLKTNTNCLKNKKRHLHNTYIQYPYCYRYILYYIKFIRCTEISNNRFIMIPIEIINVLRKKTYFVL